MPRILLAGAVMVVAVAPKFLLPEDVPPRAADGARRRRGRACAVYARRPGRAESGAGGDRRATPATARPAWEGAHEPVRRTRRPQRGADARARPGSCSASATRSSWWSTRGRPTGPRRSRGATPTACGSRRSRTSRSTRTRRSQKARGEWLLIVDADERITPALAARDPGDARARPGRVGLLDRHDQLLPRRAHAPRRVERRPPAADPQASAPSTAARSTSASTCRRERAGQAARGDVALLAPLDRGHARQDDPLRRGAGARAARGGRAEGHAAASSRASWCASSASGWCASGPRRTGCPASSRRSTSRSRCSACT